MKKQIRTLVFLLLLSSASHAQQISDFTNLNGSYLGKKPSGMIPELFAPGIVSTGAYEHGSPVFTKDLSEIYWTANLVKDGKNLTRLTYMMKCVDGVWGNVEIPDVFKGFAFVDYPFVSYDGKKLFFTASVNLKPGKDEPVKMNIYYSNRVNNTWSNPVFLDTVINNDTNEPCGVTVSKNGTIYFNRGMLGLHYSRLENGQYNTPIPMDNKFRYSKDDYTPYIAPDESYFIFSSRRPGGLGMGDLYISFKLKDGTWSEPVNMGDKINTERNERFPNLSPDGKYLFFNSSRKIPGADPNSSGNGTGDVYWVDIKIIDEFKPKELK